MSTNSPGAEFRSACADIDCASDVDDVVGDDDDFDVDCHTDGDSAHHHYGKGHLYCNGVVDGGLVKCLYSHLCFVLLP